MNKTNFDSLKNVKPPQSWVQNACKIPEQRKSKTRLLFLEYRRVITAAACILLVCIMSIPLYIFDKTKVSVPVTPATKSDSPATSENEPTDCGSQSSCSTSPDFSESPQKTTNIHDSYTEVIIHTQEGTLPVYPTDKATDVSPSVTDSGKEDIPTIPPISHTTPPMPTTPKPPTPTNPPVTTQPNPTPVEPTTGIYVATVPSCAGAFGTDDYMSADSIDDVYCCLYDSLGNLVGDPNLYSFEHIAKATPMSNGQIFVSYDPTEKGLKLKKGTYKFYFYLSGWDVVFEGEITVF